MKKIRIYFLSFLIFLSLAWWLSAPDILFTTSGFFGWRGVLVQYSGLLAFGAMTAAMVLAARPGWLERRLDGLDKMYRLHKWLGIAGIAFGLLHFLAAKGPKWLVGAGVLARPVRGKAAELASPVLQFFRSQRGMAESIGEWAFYAAVILIALALIRAVPYRAFSKSHRLFAAVYLVLVGHSVLLLDFAYWPTVSGLLLAGMAAAGTVAACVSLFGKIGAGRKIPGRVEAVGPMAGIGCVAVTVGVGDAWSGHEAGQFAFVSFHAEEGPHPYTIASHWRDDGRLVFIIKGLGDYTATLAERLAAGDAAVVEGPYGCFTFSGGSGRQIWIGGGIGVTPFIARMQAMACQENECSVDFFHTTTAVDENALRSLEEAAREANVRLRIFVDSRDGFLTGERLRETVPDWRETDVWFCGPEGFGEALASDLAANGHPPGCFHRELFVMR